MLGKTESWVTDMTKIAFVTGATGFLGMNLVKQLVELGWQVHALKRTTSNTQEFEGIEVIWHDGDITQKETLLAACPDNVDAFFHVAADTSMWRKNIAQQNRVNLTGTENAIEAALARKAKRFIQTSSISAYGAHDTTIDETTEQKGDRSFSNYHRTKHIAENMVRTAVKERGLDAVILNPCHLVGVPDTQNWSQMIRMVKENTLPGVPPGFGSFCDIEEVAKAHITAVEHGKTGENYILTGADMSFVDFVGAIGKMVGQETPSKPVPAWVLKLVGKLSELFANVMRREPNVTPEKAMIVSEQLRASSAKAQRELGYKADIDINEPLKTCYAWMQQRGLI